MAEFLVYNKTHWMELPAKDFPELIGYENVRQKIMANEALTLEQSTKALILHQWKYDARYMAGDIVEVRKDGAPRGRLEKTGVDFIRVPIAFEDATQYMAAHEDETDPLKPILLHRRKYRIDMTGVVLTDHEATLTLAEFNNRLKVKK